MYSNIILLAILAAAVIGKANSVAVAACLLLISKLLQIDKYIFPVVEKNGVNWGLILLIAAILVPIACGDINYINIKATFMSGVGIIALILSFFTTYLSGLGLQYLTVQGHNDLMPALILGSVAAAVFLKGVPVGPFITSGMIVLILKCFHKS